MKAATFHEPGDRNVIKYEEVQDPIPGPEEILVQVKACGVNRIDVWLRSGRYQTFVPHILGGDVSGRVVKISDDVKNFGIGDRVVLYPVLSDGTCTYCKNGHPNRCVNVGLLGSVINGGYAELMKIRATNAIKLPENLDYETAAAIPVNFATAWSALVTNGNVGKSDTVFVWGASSGVGSAAIQISKSRGASVITAASSNDKLEKAKDLGADYAINYKQNAVSQEVKKITGGIGASVVLDHVGEATWQQSIACLAKGGVLLSLGATTGVKAEADIGRIYRSELRVVGIFGFTKEDLLKVLEMVSEGSLRPVIDRKLPLRSAVEAHRILESGEHFGKILLLPESPAELLS